MIKKNLMKQSIIAMMIGVLAFPMAGGVHAEDGDVPVYNGEAVKIQYYNLWPMAENDPIVKMYYKLYDEFREKYPNIELEVVSDSHEAWATKSKTMMTANDLPEVFIS